MGPMRAGENPLPDGPASRPCACAAIVNDIECQFAAPHSPSGPNGHYAAERSKKEGSVAPGPQRAAQVTFC